jgi:two-component system sensor histidine kinase ChvG
LNSEAQRFVLRAQEGVDRQAAIVGAMSEANRLEASIRVAEWEQVDLAQLLNSCAEGYRAAHPGRKIETHIKPASIQLDCAPELVAQALDKLIDNAITMSADADVISMSLTLVESGVRLAVRNSGTKLPDEFQQKIFDSLVSLRDKHSQTPHLGLGLYIVRLVAEAHGGAVTARNLKGDKGVEFALDLPLSV